MRMVVVVAPQRYWRILVRKLDPGFLIKKSSDKTLFVILYKNFECSVRLALIYKSASTILKQINNFHFVIRITNAPRINHFSSTLS